MNKRTNKVLSLLLCGALTCGALGLAACTKTPSGPEQDFSHIGFMVEVNVDEGKTKYEPTRYWGYRFGRSLLDNSDGIVEG